MLRQITSNKTLVNKVSEEWRFKWIFCFAVQRDLLFPCLYILQYTEIWSIRFVGSLSIYFAVHRDLIHPICWFLVYIFCSTQRFDPSDLLVPCLYILQYTEIWSIRFVGSLPIYFAVHRDLTHPICWFLVNIFSWLKWNLFLVRFIHFTALEPTWMR